MITEEHALAELRRLSDFAVWQSEAPHCGLNRIRTWLRYAREALAPGREDIQTAKACIGVAQRLLGERD